MANNNNATESKIVISVLGLLKSVFSLTYYAVKLAFIKTFKGDTDKTNEKIDTVETYKFKIFGIWIF